MDNRCGLIDERFSIDCRPESYSRTHCPAGSARGHSVGHREDIRLVSSQKKPSRLVNAGIGLRTPLTFLDGKKRMSDSEFKDGFVMNTLWWSQNAHLQLRAVRWIPIRCRRYTRSDQSLRV